MLIKKHPLKKVLILLCLSIFSFSCLLSVYSNGKELEEVEDPDDDVDPVLVVLPCGQNPGDSTTYYYPDYLLNK